MKPKPTYIDLFAGCGGMSLGLGKSGFQGLFAIEKSEEAFETLSHNLVSKSKHFDWPKWLPKSNLDIIDFLESYKTKIKKLKGKVDLVTGSPPCQGFSVAGRRQEDDKRNDLVREYLRMVMYTRPKVIFFENVKGFTHQFVKYKSNDLPFPEYISRVLTFFGYDVLGKVIDMSKYGLPQKRIRYVLVGIRRDIVEQSGKDSTHFFKQLSSSKKKFLKTKNLSIKPRLSDAISDLLYNNGTVKSSEGNIYSSGIYGKPKSKYQKFLRRGTKNMQPDSHRFSNHKEETIKQFEYFIKHAGINRTIGDHSREKFALKKHTIIALSGKHPTPTITTQPADYVHYCEPRILTVREFARLQSFPDSFQFKGRYTTGGLHRTKQTPRYTQVGNAVPPLFAEQVGNALKMWL